MGIDVGGALNAARSWVADRLEDVDQAKSWVVDRIDEAVDGAEQRLDGFREDLVDFGRDHGGVVGEALARQVSDGLGVAEGAGLALYETGKGLVQLADGASDLVDPLEWVARPERNLETLESVGRTAQVVVELGSPVKWITDPDGNMRAVGAIWDGVTEGYRDAAAEGDWAEFAGRALFDIGSAVVGVGAAAKSGRVAGVADDVADASRALDAADDIADAGRVGTFADDAGRLSRTKMDEILAMPKGQRPDPATYLSGGYIDSHLALFDDGASRFMTRTNLDKYGIAQRDGTSFVMPKHEADALLARTQGDPRALEEALGLPEGFLDGNELVRVDVPAPRELNLRIPSGNEAGANDQWIPGGKLPTGNSEAVIDAKGIPNERYSVSPVQP